MPISDAGMRAHHELTERNKTIVREMFAGEDRVATRAKFFHPSAVIITKGTTPASGTYRQDGPEYAERVKLLGPLLPNGVTFHLDDIIGEGDRVVALVHGEGTTVHGRPYNNEYAFIIRLVDGQVVEFIEFGDTVLIETALFGKELRTPS